MEKLNLYGDRLRVTTGSHGPDISGQRLDALDRHALTAVLQNESRPCCVDLGCGLGVQGLRFAMLGACSHLYDLQAEPELLTRLRSEYGLRLQFHSGDVRTLSASSLPKQIDLAYAQRFIHFLRFEQALALLRRVCARMPAGAPFFISGSGLGSELGQGYVGRGRPLLERYAPLAPEMAAKHGILEPVCLYDPEELTALMVQAGCVPQQVWRSEFGNLKGIFYRGSDPNDPLAGGGPGGGPGGQLRE